MVRHDAICLIDAYQIGDHSFFEYIKYSVPAVHDDIYTQLGRPYVRTHCL